jgi:preprotein translocase subunit SecA
MEEGVAIESKTVSKQIERAQKAVEARNFETRKHVLKYDDVMNKQRDDDLRSAPPIDDVARTPRISHRRKRRRARFAGRFDRAYLNPQVSPDNWDVDTYAAEIQSIYAVDPAVDAGVDFQNDDGAGNRRRDLEKGD